MNNLVKIAVDAMGGDGSPKKIIDGIIHHYKNNKDSFYKIFGNQDKILNLINEDLPNNSFEIIHTMDTVKGTDSPLEGAKRGKNTSMWLAIQSVKPGHPRHTVDRLDVFIAPCRRRGHRPARGSALLHHCIIASLHHNIIAPLHHCTIASLHHCSIASLHHCIIALATATNATGSFGCGPKPF